MIYTWSNNVKPTTKHTNSTITSYTYFRFLVLELLQVSGLSGKVR